jgi:hypothetical protein
VQRFPNVIVQIKLGALHDVYYTSLLRFAG